MCVCVWGGGEWGLCERSSGSCSGACWKATHKSGCCWGADMVSDCAELSWWVNDARHASWSCGTCFQHEATDDKRGESNDDKGSAPVVGHTDAHPAQQG